jgi:TPR repeat protein
MDIDNISAKQKEHQHDDPQVLFEIGQKYAALKSMHRAIGWYKLAAAKHHTEAQISIGDYYKTKNNPKLATEWYTMAYNNGNREAAYKLGLVCKQNKDINAMEWFLKAYTSGEGKAAFQIGKMYQAGELDISRDYIQAMEWYLKGDQAGDDSSTKHIGDMYNLGLGVGSQVPVAVVWYKKAYRRGNVDAAFEIGQLYYDDVMHDSHTEKEALKWFYRAAISGHQEASDRLDDLRDEGYALGSKSQGTSHRKTAIFMIVYLILLVNQPKL